MQVVPFRAKLFTEMIATAAKPLRFTVAPYGVVGDIALQLLHRPALGKEGEVVEPKARIYLSAGMHGDERAGPLAVLKLLRENFFSPQVEWFLFPLMNPLGMNEGSRENEAGVDINRDYGSWQTYQAQQHKKWLEESAPSEGFDLCLMLHEDWESEGFYLYEEVKGEAGACAPEVLSAVQEVLPIEEADTVDTYANVGGVIHPDAAVREDLMASQTLPEALYLWEHYSPHCCTFETPSSAYIETRINAHIAAVEAAIKKVVKL